MNLLKKNALRIAARYISRLKFSKKPMYIQVAQVGSACGKPIFINLKLIFMILSHSIYPISILLPGFASSPTLTQHCTHTPMHSPLITPNFNLFSLLLILHIPIPIPLFPQSFFLPRLPHSKLYFALTHPPIFELPHTLMHSPISCVLKHTP